MLTCISDDRVWLGWSLDVALKAFALLAQARGEVGQAALWQEQAVGLESALEREAWDGDWYLRAWFDDGSPLCSTVNNECQIDSIAQSWTVIAFTALGEGDKAGALFSLLNPINHTGTRAEVERYKVEPYVVAADVYSIPPHVGRGGWTWYTGSAGWMHRAGIENIIGLQLQGAHLCLDPCIPKAWLSFRVSLRHRSSRYEVLVENPDHVSAGIASALVDGIAVAHCPLRLPLVDDGATHQVLVRLG